MSTLINFRFCITERRVRIVIGMSLHPLHSIRGCRSFTSRLRLVRNCGGALVSRREMGGEVQYTVNKNGGRLAYHKVSGTTPNVLYIPGLNIQYY